MTEIFVNYFKRRIENPLKSALRSICVIVGLPCQNKIWFYYVEFKNIK
jgi:hypothetical protein